MCEPFFFVFMDGLCEMHGKKTIATTGASTMCQSYGPMSMTWDEKYPHTKPISFEIIIIITTTKYLIKCNCKREKKW